MPQTRQPLPKVVLFTAGPMATPAVQYLLQQKQLAGVAIADRSGTADPAFLDELTRLGVPCRDISRSEPNRIADACAGWGAEVGFIIGFPRILPPAVLHCFEYGVYNLHPSALPAYRGAMPLYWLIRNGETETQLTLHKAGATADSGDIVFQQPLAIHPRETLHSLSIQVAQHAPLLLHRLLEAVRQHGAAPAGRPQQGRPDSAPWPDHNDTLIDWTGMPGAKIEAMARAGNPTFGATLMIRKTPVALMQATPVEVETFGTGPGTLVHIGEPEGVIAATCDAAVRLDILSSAEGLFGGVAFAERFQLEAGMQFDSPSAVRKSPQAGPEA